jgi:hypothetical protein
MRRGSILISGRQVFVDLIHGPFDGIKDGMGIAGELHGDEDRPFALCVTPIDTIRRRSERKKLCVLSCLCLSETLSALDPVVA